MPSNIINLAEQQPAATATAQLFENWFDPIETAVRDRVHGFIQAMIEAELDEALSRREDLTTYFNLHSGGQT